MLPIKLDGVLEAAQEPPKERCNKAIEEYEEKHMVKEADRIAKPRTSAPEARYTMIYDPPELGSR